MRRSPASWHITNTPLELIRSTQEQGRIAGYGEHRTFPVFAGGRD